MSTGDGHQDDPGARDGSRPTPGPKGNGQTPNRLGEPGGSSRTPRRAGRDSDVPKPGRRWERRTGQRRSTRPTEESLAAFERVLRMLGTG
jgi:hypothetical protein